MMNSTESALEAQKTAVRERMKLLVGLLGGELHRGRIIYGRASRPSGLEFQPNDYSAWEAVSHFSVNTDQTYQIGSYNKIYASIPLDRIRVVALTEHTKT